MAGPDLAMSACGGCHNSVNGEKIRTDSWDARGKSLGHFLTASVAQRLCSSLRHEAFSFEN